MFDNCTLDSNTVNQIMLCFKLFYSIVCQDSLVFSEFNISILTLFQVAFLLLLHTSQLWAYSKGPPLSRCESMVPHHSPFQPQSGIPPFSISVSSYSYDTGGNLAVNITGSNSKTFKGFFLQARGIDSSVAWPIGEFTDIPDRMCIISLLKASLSWFKLDSQECHS